MSSQNVSLNSYNLQDATIATNKILHEGLIMEEAKVVIPHRDGAKVVNKAFGERSIVLEGMISSPTASGLDGKIDELKKNTLGLLDVNLDLDYVGGTRRYQVNVKELVVVRDYHHITAAPYQLKLEAVDPPFGLDTTTISGISTNTTISGSTLTTSVTISGTATPAPLVRFVVKTAGSLTDIELKNNTSGTAIKITPTAFANNDVIELDLDAFTVKRNGAAVNYTGLLPDFLIGLNSLEINMYGGNNIDVQQTVQDGTYSVYGQFYLAQTLKPNTTTNFNKLDVMVQKVGTPADALTIAVYANSAGAPGALVASAFITANNISDASLAFISETLSTFALTAGTTYWLVISSAGSNASGYYLLGTTATNPYADGTKYTSNNFGGSYTQVATDDLAFRLYKTQSADWQVGYGLQYVRRWL